MPPRPELPSGEEVEMCGGASAAAARSRGRRACQPQNHTSVDASGVEGGSDSASDPCPCAGGHRECAHPMARQLARWRLEEKAGDTVARVEGMSPGTSLAALTLKQTST